MVRFLVSWTRLLYFLLVLPIFLFGDSASMAQDSIQVQSQFKAAQDKFETAQSREDFLDAARSFESILTEGFESGTIRFNAGNAYFRANQFGRSILNYRKAKQLRPNDPYVQANLKQALALSPGRLPESGKPWWKSFLFWSDWLAPATKTWIASIGLASMGVMLLLAIWLQKTWLRLVGLAILLVSSLVVWDAWNVKQQIENSKMGVVVAETIARKGTGDDYSPAFDQPLQDGAEFIILSETNNWTFGRFEGAGDGWIRNEFVAR